jgi:hypothetical protein
MRLPHLCPGKRLSASLWPTTFSRL